jgi:hypothetical protein
VLRRELLPDPEQLIDRIRGTSVTLADTAAAP